MKIAYGTYAMPHLPLEQAIPMLHAMGYEGVEICLSPSHAGSMPQQLDAYRRTTIARLLLDHGMGVPALFILRSILHDDDEGHRENLEFTCAVAQLARDLGLSENPVIALPIGGKSERWEQDRDRIAAQLADYGELGAREGFVVAGELHRGAAVDSSARCLWLVEQVGRDNVGIHFDVVHTFTGGERVEDSVRNLASVTRHTHVTDARRREDGEFALEVLGKGELDVVAYARAMHETGWDDFITVEVSMRIWGQDDYDVEEVARISYATLERAFVAAGVPRG